MRVALLLATLSMMPGVAAAATGHATVQTERASARLVLEWPRRVDYTVSQSGSYVFVRFSRPFTGSLEKVRAPLARYVAELRLAGDGRVLVLRLAGRPYFAHLRRGNSIVFTWIGGDPAARSAPPARTAPPERASPAEHAGPEKRPNAAARTTPARRLPAADNPTDSEAPPVRAGPKEPSQPHLAIRQEPPKRPATPPEVHAARPPQPKSEAPAPKSPTAARETGPSRPAVPPATRAKPGPAETPDAAEAERARPSVPYTDALLPPPRPQAPPARVERPAPPPPERAPPSGPALKSPGAAGDALPPRPAPPPAAQAERPAVPQPDLPRPAAPAAPRAEEAQPPRSMAKVPEAIPPAAPEIRPAPQARPAPDGPLEPPVMPAVSPTLNVTTDGAETRIVLAWPEPMAAAVFCLGDHVWMVFPRREAFDLQKVQKQLGPGVESLKRVEHAQATLLAARVAGGMRVRVAHERNVWTIALKRDNGVPALPDVKLAISRNGIEQAALPLPGAETPIRFVVPGNGSVLYVVPSRATAAAGGERAFVAFRILPAAQGGVIEALADGLVVGAEGGAITIRRTNGLLLSNGGPPISGQHGQ